MTRPAVGCGQRHDEQVAQDCWVTTRDLMGLVESYGYQFLKDKGGWACFDDDTRREVPLTRDGTLGNAVHLAGQALGLYGRKS